MHMEFLYHNHTWRRCELEFTDIHKEIRFLFGILFILCGILTTCGNALAFYFIVRPVKRDSQKRNSDKILLSLVVVDLITGLVVSPTMGFEQFFTYYKPICHFQAVTISSVYVQSSITIAFIAYYRCRTLIKHVDCEQYLDSFNINLLIIAWWVLPPVVCAATYFRSLHVYVPMLCMVFVTTLLIVCISYVIIMLLISRVKKSLRKSHCVETQARFKIGKKVTAFITCYMLCFLPIAIMLSINLDYLTDHKHRSGGLQIFFIVADFMACLNSCLNPWVYTLKYPGLKEKARRRKREKQLMRKYAVVVH